MLGTHKTRSHGGISLVEVRSITTGVKVILNGVEYIYKAEDLEINKQAAAKEIKRFSHLSTREMKRRLFRAGGLRFFKLKSWVGAIISEHQKTLKDFT